ncbi:MAG: TrbI/VirB10 family protein [Gammaproteobacteria bacterium]|nr:TrbI/VirB10 family protein [Gammaproteobacteria bacterium]
MKYIVPIPVLLTSLTLYAADFTQDEYRKAISQSEQKIDYSQSLINHDKLHELIVKPDQVKRQKPRDLRESFKQKTGAEGSTSESATTHGATGGVSDAQKGTIEPTVGGREAVSESKGNANLSAAHAGLNHSGKTKADAKPSSVNSAASPSSKSGKGSTKRYVYIPPGLQDEKTVQNDIVIRHPLKTVAFGIPIGTRIPVELKTGASNVQPGYVQLIVKTNIVGDKKTLPAGSTIFCRASAVIGSARLFAVATKGITIHAHDEFSVSGNVFAADGSAGLLASIVSDGRSIHRAGDAGLASLGAGVIGMIPGADVATEAGKSAAEVVVSEQLDKRKMSHGRVNYVLEAGPQHAVLQIEETF